MPKLGKNSENLSLFLFLGCMMTPKQGMTVCEEHSKNTMEFEDSLKDEKNKESNIQGIIKICSKKETRTSTLYEVYW